MRTHQIRRLPCSDHLKEIVYRCIGERRTRYEGADELIQALSNPPATLRVGVLRSLKGAHLAFTGVHGAPSARTNVAVRGRPNPLQAAGRNGGRKLVEIKRLREKGHRSTLLNETQFWRLADRR